MIPITAMPRATRIPKIKPTPAKKPNKRSMVYRTTKSTNIVSRPNTASFNQTSTSQISFLYFMIIATTKIHRATIATAGHAMTPIIANPIAIATALIAPNSQPNHPVTSPVTNAKSPAIPPTIKPVASNAIPNAPATIAPKLATPAENAPIAAAFTVSIAPARMNAVAVAAANASSVLSVSPLTN